MFRSLPTWLVIVTLLLSSWGGAAHVHPSVDSASAGDLAERPHVHLFGHAHHGHAHHGHAHHGYDHHADGHRDRVRSDGASRFGNDSQQSERGSGDDRSDAPDSGSNDRGTSRSERFSLPGIGDRESHDAAAVAIERSWTRTESPVASVTSDLDLVQAFMSFPLLTPLGVSLTRGVHPPPESLASGCPLYLRLLSLRR